jgi:hypothetical protein
MASGDVIIATDQSAVHRYTLAMVSLLGYQKSIPPGFHPKWGGVGGGITMSDKMEKALKKKKKKRGTWWGGASKPADLTKIFGNAQLRMEQAAERDLRELGLDNNYEGEEKSNKTTQSKKQLNEVSNTMSQNMNKLTERGEMISEIQEKTSKLVLNAMLFEQQCKQINKAQQDDCTIM